MKFIELSCPHCGGQLDLHDDRKFAECIYCGHKAMILEDKAVEVDDKSKKVDPEFEKLRYAIINDGENSFEFVPDSVDEWFLKGYDNLKNNLYDGENFKQCEAAWRVAFSKLDSEYLLTDYSRLIGTCLGKLEDYDLDYDDNPGYSHRLLETLNEYICERFGIDFTTDFYYAVFVGFSKTADLEEEETAFNLMLHLVSNTLRCEPHPETFVTKCHQFEKTIRRFNNESLENDGQMTVGMIGYAIYQKYKEMPETLQNACKSKWTESRLINEFGHVWDQIEKKLARNPQ